MNLPRTVARFCDVRPMDVVRLARHHMPVRVLRVSSIVLPGYGPRTWIEGVSQTYEGWPGGTWGYVDDSDALILREPDLIPTVLHPTHQPEIEGTNP